MYKPVSTEVKPQKETKQRLSWKTASPESSKMDHVCHEWVQEKTSSPALTLDRPARNVHPQVKWQIGSSPSSTCVSQPHHPKAFSSLVILLLRYYSVSHQWRAGGENSQRYPCTIGELIRHKVKPTVRRIPVTLISASHINKGWKIKHLLKIKFCILNMSNLNNAKKRVEG